MKARTGQAAALHRQAAATVTAAALALDANQPGPANQREQHDLVERLRTAAGDVAPGWLGATLDAQSEDAPLGGAALPTYVRIGTAQPLDDARFPVIVPLLGTGHLTVDADVRDSRVGGLLRSVLLRLLAAVPAGALLVRGVDAATAGMVFAPFAPLADAGLMPPPVTDRVGLRGVLAEAEQWVRPARPNAARHRRRDRVLLLVIASLPELTEPSDLARISTLAQHGPEAGLHLVVAGWPPPPLTAETTQAPLAHTTMVTLRNPYALVGDPPGSSFSTPLPHLPSTGLNCPVFVDDDPPAHLVDRVCRELAAQFEVSSRVTLGDLLPDEAGGVWTEDATEGLVTTVGHDGDRAVTLQFNDLTPHWMVGGRPGAGKSAFLTNVLFGLCTRYGPTELAVHLVDFKEGSAFAEVVPTERDPSWLPQVRTAGMECGREYGLSVLRALDAELARRAAVVDATGEAPDADSDSAASQEEPAARQDRRPEGGPAAGSRFAELRQRERVPRVLCLLDEYPELLGGDDPVATEAVGLLDSLARRGRSFGIHLILSSRVALTGDRFGTGRDGLFGQFPVRVALPGGSTVLEPTNDSAAGLPLGTAVINTAGGLGGPRGATRGHERMIRFPDPGTERAFLSALRRQLHAAGAQQLNGASQPAVGRPPVVFAGYDPQHLADDPTYRSALPGGSRPPAVLLGRVLDVRLPTAAFPLGSQPGRHLAVLGSAPAGADLLDAAARSLAAQHPNGSVRFVVTSALPAGAPAATALAAELAVRQKVEVVEPGHLADVYDGERPDYLVVFGMEALDSRADPGGAGGGDGEPTGPHLLAWWSDPGRFVKAAGKTPTGEDFGGLVLLDVPGRILVPLGVHVDWRPRPDRALLLDRHTGTTSTMVPFTPSGGAA